MRGGATGGGPQTITELAGILALTQASPVRMGNYEPKEGKLLLKITQEWVSALATWNPDSFLSTHRICKLIWKQANKIKQRQLLGNSLSVSLTWLPVPLTNLGQPCFQGKGHCHLHTRGTESPSPGHRPVRGP